ncbi:MAG: poly-gamma-glutamate synthase PgsB, partial [Candidatus Aminicenantales bacterium]
MNILIPGSAVFLLWGAGLLLERKKLARFRAGIPLRICVAGTRGKSAVTRHIAAALRASGRTVLAKTTGSKPVVILPDGSEREIPRPGPPSVLEQKRVLALAARLKADALVMEMMSIRPECLAAESGKILRPGLLVLTNVRLDHEEEMGRTKDEVAASLAAAISPRCEVLVPAAEWRPVFGRAARETNSRVVQTAPDDALPSGLDFPENVGLALAAAARLGLDRETALKGMTAARPDFGGLKIWSMTSPVSGRTWHFGGIFAANEPESTRIALDRVRARVPFAGCRTIALHNLRADRASRTRQWLAAIRDDFFAGFDRIVFIGEQASALGRKRFPKKTGGPAIGSIAARSADKVMAALWPMSAEDTV